ncbi:MAG: hypothetical protein AAF202_11255 [Pseudomonadota bacterium]
MSQQQPFITTSQGVYLFADGMDSPQVCLKRERRIPFFKKGGFGFFGISAWRDQVVVASRENFSRQQFAKHSEDVQIYRIDPVGQNHRVVARIPGVADVHQIAVHGDLCFLTDTGHNQITVFDLNECKPITQLEVGPERKDINHINAVTIDADTLYLGLNNRGNQDAQVLSMSLSKIDFENPVNQVYAIAENLTLNSLKHTHDFEKVGQDWVVSASHQGSVFRANPTEELCKPGKWVRGLADSRQGFWIGMSELLDRKNRHREDVDGELALWSRDFSREEKRVPLKQAGQVNDLLVVD